jgi:hypothetical protein
MMGPEKLGTIRSKLRESFPASEAELLASFNRQIEEVSRSPGGGNTAADTLRLLRDALVAETKKPRTPRRKRVARGPKR